MRLPKFEHLQPTRLDEAFDLLERHKGEAKLLAGGTDIIVRMKHRMMTPKYLVSLSRIPDLDYIRSDDGALKIGAMARLNDIGDHPVVNKDWAILAQAARSIGSVQSRNRATMAGNICNASPSADSAPSLIALNSQVVLVSKGGERILPVEEFFKGPGETAIKAGEILKEIQVPKMNPKSGGYYLKYSMRGAMDLAIVGVACIVTPNGKAGYCEDVRIVLGAVCPTPLRIREAEEALKNKAVDEAVLEKAARIAMDESCPISDVRSSAEYRKKMVKVMTRRAFNKALSLAKAK